MITHNIEKTLNCDKILVLAGGRVKEFDTPKNLLNNVSSAYYEVS
jgi:ATP-binding cassette subfamily C (CFTR/MRP) protein 1